MCIIIRSILRPELFNLNNTAQHQHNKTKTKEACAEKRFTTEIHHSFCRQKTILNCAGDNVLLYCIRFLIYLFMKRNPLSSIKKGLFFGWFLQQFAKIWYMFVAGLGWLHCWDAAVLRSRLSQETSQNHSKPFKTIQYHSKHTLWCTQIATVQKLTLYTILRQ